MKPFVLGLIAALLLVPTGALATEGGGITIEVKAQFMQSTAMGTEWSAEFLDADGNPATEENWVNMTLTAGMANNSSQNIVVEWRLPDEIEGVTPLTPGAMARVPLGMGESGGVELRFERDPEIPLPAGGMKLEYVISGDTP